jgi:hypothetical protein
LISDQTPWKNLSENCAGWDLPLERPDQFAKVIDDVLLWEGNMYQKWSQGAQVYVEKTIRYSDIQYGFKMLFS